MTVEVTASIIEIQQRDPHFRWPFLSVRSCTNWGPAWIYLMSFVLHVRIMCSFIHSSGYTKNYWWRKGTYYQVGFMNLYPLQVLGNYGILLLCVFLLFEGVTCKFASVKFCFDICCMLWPQVNYICFLVMVPHNCRGQQANNGSLSEEMLAMLYCMAIIRWGSFYLSTCSFFPSGGGVEVQYMWSEIQWW